MVEHENMLTYNDVTAFEFRTAGFLAVTRGIVTQRQNNQRRMLLAIYETKVNFHAEGDVVYGTETFFGLLRI